MSIEADGRFAFFGCVAFAKCDTEATVRNGVGIKMDYILTEMLLPACLRFRPGPGQAGAGSGVGFGLAPASTGSGF